MPNKELNIGTSLHIYPHNEFKYLWMFMNMQIKNASMSSGQRCNIYIIILHVYFLTNTQQKKERRKLNLTGQK